jgi:hypothetical protein
MIMNKRGQGTIEYLVIIAVVIVIALVVVGLVVDTTSQSSTGGAAKSSKVNAMSQIVGVNDAAIGTDSNGLFVLQNNTGETIRVTGFVIDGTTYPTGTSIAFAQNDVKSFALSNLPICDSPTQKTYQVKVNYTSDAGLEKTVDYGTLYIDCIARGAVALAAPPVISASNPATLAYGTTSYALDINTDVNANCKYDSSSGVAFASQTHSFSGSVLAHSATISPLVTGANNIYIKCQSVSNSTISDDTHVTITVGADSTPPVISGSNPASLAFGTTSTSISITTDENATCKDSNNSGTAYASMTNTFTGTATSHSATISGLVSGSNNVYIRCIDTTGNPNLSDFLITITVLANPMYNLINFDIAGDGLSYTASGKFNDGQTYKWNGLNGSTTIYSPTLKDANNRTAYGISATSNLGGGWGSSSHINDAMVNNYNYNGSLIKLIGFPAGDYNVILYSAPATSDTFTLATDLASYGSKTANGTPNSYTWVENEQYVIYSGVHISDYNDPIKISVPAEISGIQVVPPTALPTEVTPEYNSKLKQSLHFDCGGDGSYTGNGKFNDGNTYKWNPLANGTTTSATIKDGNNNSTEGLAVISNMAGNWGGTSGVNDAMFNGYIYNGSLIKLIGLPAGDYNLILYGLPDDATVNNYSIATDIVNYGSKSAGNGHAKFLSRWVNGEQYTTINNIHVSDYNDPIKITVSQNISGLQVLTSNSLALQAKAQDPRLKRAYNFDFAGSGTYNGSGIYNDRNTYYWNVPGGGISSPSLKDANGNATSGIVFTVTSGLSGGYSGSTNLSDDMFNNYAYQGGSTSSFTITGLPTNDYNFVIYASPWDASPSQYTLSVGGVSQGTRSSGAVHASTLARWYEGEQYVNYPSINVTSSDTVQVSIAVSGGYSVIAGLQIVPLV